jgi:hypothetical protein
MGFPQIGYQVVQAPAYQRLHEMERSGRALPGSTSC